jgi:hypothetical protein
VGLIEQTLHAVGGEFSGGLGQLPRVLALGSTDKTFQVSKRSQPRFGTGETASDSVVQ